MRRTLLLFLVATGALLGVAAQAVGEVPTGDNAGVAEGASTTSGTSPDASGGADAAPGRALLLLTAAARAARARSWSATQHVSTWRDGAATSLVVRVEHDPRWGTRVRSARPDGEVGPAAGLPVADLDGDLLTLLAARYTLSVAAPGRCDGRTAQVVEARRGAAVAARFWLDVETGLPLRRDVLDPAGRLASSSTATDLAVSDVSDPADADLPGSDLPGTGAAGTGVAGTGPTGSGVNESRATGLDITPPTDDGWQVPGALPGGFRLYAARPADADSRVMQLAYSDGLSSTSVFVQPGQVGHGPGHGFRAGRVGGARVWFRDGVPGRAVWGGHGRVYTLVSDAAPDQVVAAIGSLPHDTQGSPAMGARFGRGLARAASWVNPFG